MWEPMQMAERNEAFGGIWDSIKKGAAAVIPKKTIVGKALSGDWAGAGAASLKAVLGGGGGSPPAVTTPSALPPGVSGLKSFSSGTSPMLYVGLAGLAAALIFLRMKK
jgi:hypothetical protein